jgi:hypothetical protein
MGVFEKSYHPRQGDGDRYLVPKICIDFQNGRKLGWGINRSKI